MPDTWITPRIWTTAERVGQSKMNEISNNLRVLFPYTAANQVVYSVDTDKLGVVSITSLQAPVGSVIFFGGSSAPASWLLCDGSLISRTTYSALFAIIGTTFGAGDGLTTFKLPDMRGRVAIGTGTGTDLSNRVLGATGGEEIHIIIPNEMPSHDHTISDIAVVPDSGGDSGSRYSQGLPGSYITTNSTGGNAAHNNMQPFLALNAIIKT